MPHVLTRSLFITLLYVPLGLGRAPARAQEGGFARARPEEVGMSSARLQDAMDSVRAWVARDRIRGGIVLVIRHGKLVFHEAAGWSDRERAVALRTDHIVSMRSMTKPLVGAAILMLREEGRLKLEDRVARYLPSFDNERSREITIFQLLTHTAGITGALYTDTGGTHFKTLRQAVDSVGIKGPSIPPGTRYSYSDPGTSTLGAIIAQVSGQSAEDFIQQRILTPLGMKDSYLLVPDGPAQRTRFAATYRRENGQWTRYWDNSLPMIVPFFRASGGLWSTALDYARFMTMMLQHGRFEARRLLDSTTVALALQPHSAYAFSAGQQRERQQFYALHWIVYTDRYRPVAAPFVPGIFEHSGSDGTQAWADPVRGLVLIYLTQSRGHDTRLDLVRLIYRAIEDASATR
jgi:CubicO group peptidase (beta-lactamase class C family)